MHSLELNRISTETGDQRNNGEKKILREGVKASTEKNFFILTYDGSQAENVRQTAVHGFIRRILQEIITCEEDNHIR